MCSTWALLVAAECWKVPRTSVCMDGLVRWSMLHSKSERSAGSKCHQPHAYRQSLRLSRARVLLDRFPGLCVGCDRGEHAQDGLRWRGGREDMLDCARHRRGDECDLVRVLWRRYLGHPSCCSLCSVRASYGSARRQAALAATLAVLSELAIFMEMQIHGCVMA